MIRNCKVIYISTNFLIILQHLLVLIRFWHGKRFSEESIKSTDTSDNKIGGKIKGNCLKISFNLRNEVNLFIVYELETSPFNQGLDFTLGICLFGAVKLTEDADPDKYGYTEAATGGVL